MFRSITTVVATLAVSGFVHAQDAVQWTEAEGGNGHWYQFIKSGEISFTQARIEAQELGGDLGVINSQAINEWIVAELISSPDDWMVQHGPWIGLFQDTSADDYEEPDGGWYWVNGEPLDYSDWADGEGCQDMPAEFRCSGEPGCNFATYYALYVEDIPVTTWGSNIDSGDSVQVSYLVEYSADCNGDGIVDYGQILNGSLADKDGNGVPDCCEDATCLPAVQWKVEDGGNDNWYRFVRTEDLVAWDVAASDASNLGGHLATITTPDENQFIVDNFDGLGSGQTWIGLFQNTSSPDYSEPGGGWEWVTQESFNWTNWTPGEPNNSGKDEQSEEWGNIWLTGGDQPNYIGFWNDNVLLDVNRSDSYLIEWSDDCNGDGIVDYGQILDGSLLDENGNGIPDICQQFDFGACCYNGGCVLTTNDFCFEAGGSYAGDGTLCEEVDCPTTCPGDIDGDGQVGVIDILIVIDRWGFCP